MRAAPGAFCLAGLVGIAAAGCGGASPDSGIGAELRLAGAQYVPGEISSDSSTDAPTIQTLSIATTIIYPGATGISLGGSANDGSAVLIGLVGDVGHWVVPTGVEDPENPGAFLFTTSLSLSPLIPLAPQAKTVVFRAVDAHGTVGPAKELVIKVQALGSSGAVPPLRVTLTWDTEADLDLKLRVPNAANPAKPIDVWNKSTVALPPLGNGDQPYTSDEIAAAGQLDFDSNAQCLIDGRRQEDVTFPQAPPSGQYTVHVDAFSLCGQVAAQWHVFALRDGQMIGQAYGQAGDVDTQGSHGPASGTLAFTFMVP